MAKEEIIDGVTIPEEAIVKSEAMKKAHRTLRQTQVYRDMANLKYIIAEAMTGAPRKYAKYFDQMLTTASHAKQSLAMALGTKGTSEQRQADLSYALVMVEDLQDDFTILCQLGIMAKHDKKRNKVLAQRIAGQIVRLRDYFGNEGIK